MTSHLCKLGTVAGLVIATVTATAAAWAAPATTVRVEAGDTLEAIATRNGTSVAALQLANPQVKPEALQVGQRRRLPPPRGMVQVAAGDTLEAIALRQGTSVAALQLANPQVRPEALQVGEWLQLPLGALSAARTSAPTVVPAAASPGPDPKAEAALLLSPGERRDRATLTLRERSGQLSWRRFGSTLVDWSGWQLHPGGVRITLVQPALADVGARRSGATAIAVQCSSLRHTWRIDGDWERWSSPGADSVAQRIVLQLCSNTLDGPAAAIPPPPDSGQ